MDSKTRGIVAYITLIGWIVAIATNSPKDEHSSFHIRQMLGLFLGSLVCSFIPFVNFVAWIFWMVLWIIALVGAVNNERKEVPLLGSLFQDWFKSL